MFDPIGIFFKYDIEPMSLTIRERTTTLIQFLVRLAGIVGGILGSSALCAIVSNEYWLAAILLSLLGLRFQDCRFPDIGSSRQEGWTFTWFPQKSSTKNTEAIDWLQSRRWSSKFGWNNVVTNLEKCRWALRPSSHECFIASIVVVVEWACTSKAVRGCPSRSVLFLLWALALLVSFSS